MIVKLKGKKNFPFRVQFFTVTLLASIYLGAIYLTDMGYYFHNWDNHNVFILLKMIFITIPFMGWVLLIAVYYCKSNTLRSNTKALCLRWTSFLVTISSHWRNISRVALVGLLTHEIVLILLSIFPTLLLLFAQPTNTFALLVIHIAIFYTETLTGMLVIEQLNKSMCIQKLLHKCRSSKWEHNKEGFTEQACKSKRYNKLLSMAHNTWENEGGEIEDSIINGVVLIIGVAPMFIGLGFVYMYEHVSVKWFYQFLFLRNFNNNFTFDIHQVHPKCWNRCLWISYTKRDIF